MEKDWKEQLSPEEYYVCRKKGTEPAFSGKYDKFYEPGIYLCKCERSRVLPEPVKPEMILKRCL